jgi:hypothetical protein
LTPTIEKAAKPRDATETGTGEIEAVTRLWAVSDSLSPVPSRGALLRGRRE